MVDNLKSYQYYVNNFVIKKKIEIIIKISNKMEAFFSALISGIIGLFISDQQHRQNISDWQMQNNYNENMYNEYNSPSARVEQLKNAGLSDAAIGQALSGFSGSGTSIASAPIQPNNISDSLSSIFGNINDTMRVGNETKLNYEEIKLKGLEQGLKGNELKLFEKTFNALAKKPYLENSLIKNEAFNYEMDSNLKESQYNLNEALKNKYGVETDLLEIERYINSGTKSAKIRYIENQVRLQQSELNLNDAQIKNLTANIEFNESLILFG